MQKIHELAIFHGMVEKFVPFADASGAFATQLLLGTEVYEGRGSSIRAAKLEVVVQALNNTEYVMPMTIKTTKSQSSTERLQVLATRKGVAVDFT
jgi:hypothetical protein